MWTFKLLTTQYTTKSHKNTNVEQHQVNPFASTTNSEIKTTPKSAKPQITKAKILIITENNDTFFNAKTTTNLLKTSLKPIFNQQQKNLQRQCPFLCPIRRR